MENDREIIKKGRAVIDAGCYFSVWVFDSERDLDPVRNTSEHGADAFERACTQYYHSAFGFSLLPAV